MFRTMRRSRQAQTIQVCHQILSDEKRGVLSMIGDGGYPYAIPINFYFDPTENTLYFHGAKSGHKVDAILACDKVCFTTWNTGYRTPGSWEWNVTSVICMGRARLVQDPALTHEKIWNMAVKYHPDLDEARADFDRSIHRAQLFAIEIQHISGKLVNER